MSEPTLPAPRRQIASILQLEFGGYFMARLATDPDPTTEQRGISGYTMALASEPPLDQVIRLQLDPDAHPDRRLRVRDPAGELGIQVGVNVRDVRFDGDPYHECHGLLMGARLSLEGGNWPFPGPIFESRNNIVGADDTMSFIINPFELAVYPPGDGSLSKAGEALLRATDYLDPVHPERRVWEIEDPSTYARRLPKWTEKSIEVLDQLQVYQPQRYFDRRLAWLQSEQQRQCDPQSMEAQELASRIYQLGLWGPRMVGAFAYQLTYDFRTNGKQEVHERLRGLGEFDTEHPWHFNCWFGGWDGDLLVGYCKGTLSIPFRPR
jgi:hypothetical protein